ncbi:MAG: tetratricopeptide repeat protein [bacterium]|nr:tetratricopeptide repeat protein [bacterium]
MDSRWRFLLALGGMLGLSFLLYGNTLHGEFVYDDALFAFRDDLRDPATLIRVWREPYTPGVPENGNYRPFTVFTFVLNALAFSEAPGSFHVVNVLLNGCATFLAFLVVRRLSGNTALGVIASLLYAVLPIHSEVVASIKSRDELLGAVFALLAWLAFLRATVTGRLHRRFFLASVALFLLAALSKELFIVMPFVYLAAWKVQSKTSWERLLSVGSPFFLAVGIVLLLRFLVLGQYAFGTDLLYWVSNPLQDAPYRVRFWTAFRLATLYVQKTFFPTDLSATYYYNHLPLVTDPLASGEVWAGAGLLGAVVFLLRSRAARRWSPLLSVGAAAFLFPYLMISKFLFTGGTLFGERLMYFPSFGLAMITSVPIAKLYGRSRVLGVSALLFLLGTFGALTVSRSTVWRTNETLFQSMIHDAPNSIQGYFNMAVLRFEQQNTRDANAYAQRASAIYEEHPPLLHLRGKIAMVEGDAGTAERYFARAATLRPKDREYHVYRGLALAKLGRYEESIVIARAAVAQQSDDPQARFLMAVNLYKLGQREDARAFFDWNPRLPESEKLRLLEEF